MVGFNAAQQKPVADEGEDVAESGDQAGTTAADQAGKVELLGTVIKNMFPTLDPHDPQFSLAQCRRVALWRYDAATDTIEFRHYAVQEELVGADTPTAQEKEQKAETSNLVQSMLKKGFGRAKGAFKTGPKQRVSAHPDDSDDDDEEFDSDLSDAESEFSMLSTDTATTSASLMTTTTNASSMFGEKKRARVRLTELGPRMCLQAIKAEEGLYDGGVLFHRYVQKTAGEEDELRRIAKKRAKEKADKNGDKKDKNAKHNEDNPHNKKKEKIDEAKLQKRDMPAPDTAGPEMEDDEEDEDEIMEEAAIDDENDEGEFGDEVEVDNDYDAEADVEGDEVEEDNDAMEDGEEEKSVPALPKAEAKQEYVEFGSSKSGSKNYHKHKHAKGKKGGVKK